jgi:hypothetical protein
MDKMLFMKKLLYPFLFVFISIIALNCQKELSFPGEGNTSGNSLAPIKATLQGRVLDENNQPAAGVVVRAGGMSVTTDAKGYFRIIKAPLDKNASLVIAEKSGYFKAYRTFQATAGANHVVIKLIKRSLAGTISASGGEVILTNGAKIALPANAVVKAAGSSTYTGNINVYAAYIDPISSDIGQTVPGSFMADDKDGKRVTLASYGMLAVELESASGEKLQIASGKTATLTSPIPSSILSAAPATISLWYVDEQTGLWKEEGSAVKNGNNYVGEVKHFSFWNCDAGFPGINLSFKLVDAQNTPMIHVSARLTRSTGGWWPTAYGYTDSMGIVSGLVPTGETLLLEVLNDCGNPVYSQNIGPFSQNTNLGSITVTTTTSSLLTISGVVVNCTGAPVTNGVAIVNYDGWPRYVSTGSNGAFSLTFLRCTGSPATCDITAVDNTAQQQGSATFAVTGPALNTGNIIACGTSAAQFINYTFDGVNYSITSAEAPDSIYAFTYPTGTPVVYSNDIMGFKYSLNRNIRVRFTSPAQVPGIYPIEFVSVQDFTWGTTMIAPSTVTVTSFPASSGGFFEGSFTGSFRDSLATSPVHTINGNFKVRRY